MNIAVIVVEFTEEIYSVSEDGPAVQVCIRIISGRVGPDGLVINVTNVGGSATGENLLYTIMIIIIAGYNGDQEAIDQRPLSHIHSWCF